MDVCHAFTTEAHDPVKISQADPVLKAPAPEGFRTWFTGPIKRYCRNVETVELRYGVDPNRPISGSYGLQYIARIELDNGQHREFVVFHARRYDLDKLGGVLQHLGWKEMGRFPFGSTERPRSLLMFQRQ